ncbi:enoyl-CoA hydratase/isomerase family protein [soil metagenome]
MEAVQTEVVGAVATVTMQRPHRRNGMNLAMVHGMYETLLRLAERQDIKVVILTGAGGDFCIGADIGGDGGSTSPPEYEALAPTYHTSRMLHEMPQVTIAAIDGGCAGAGLAWAAACDFRFATERARFSTAFLAVGVAGDMGAAWLLERIVGPARAREMLYFPTKITGGEALAFDLVTRLFDAEELQAKTAELAAELAGRSAFALRAMKANFVSAEKLSLADFIEIEGARHMHVVNGREAREAFAAFAAKAPKDWAG